MSDSRERGAAGRRGEAALGIGGVLVWDAGPVFERFTERARQVVVLAQEEARDLRHDYIGTEHILLGLLRETEGLAARVLESLDISVERARGQVVRIVGSGEDFNSGQIPFSPRAKKVLESALREALRLGHNYVGTEHILLGLAHDDDGVASRILLDFDADSEKIHNAVLRMLAGPSRGERASARRIGPRIELHPDLPPPVLDWHRASILWRPEGLELRVPLQLTEGAMAAFASDPVWSSAPLAEMRREIWNGWLALASPSLLDQTNPVELRRALDDAAKRALDVSGREHGRVEDFLQRLRNGK